MIKTRGGQGTAENYIPDLPNLKVGLDIDHRTRIHLINILRDMQANRYTKNEALEKNKKERDDKKRSRPDNGPDKRVTIRDTLAEIDMFQTEHLKLREFVQKQATDSEPAQETEDGGSASDLAPPDGWITCPVCRRHFVSNLEHLRIVGIEGLGFAKG